METEQVRNVARQLDAWAANLLTSAAALRSTSGRLSVAWQGRNAESFNGGLRNWLRDFEAQAQQLQNLSLRASREADEWESADRTSEWGTCRASIQKPALSSMSALTGAGIFTIGTYPALSNTGVMTAGTTPAIITNHEKPSWFAEHFIWGGDAGGEGSYKTKSGKRNWHRNEYFSRTSKGTPNRHREKLDYGVEAKAGFGGTVAEGKYHSWGKWEVGAKAGLSKDGLSAGLYAEGSVFEAHGSKVFGSSMFGFTLTGGASTGSVEGFAGLKDNTVGASIGGSLASGEAGLGLNILGINVQLTGGAAAGLQAGVKVGAKNEVKLGPFMLGLNFGPAITE